MFTFFFHNYTRNYYFQNYAEYRGINSNSQSKYFTNKPSQMIHNQFNGSYYLNLALLNTRLRESNFSLKEELDQPFSYTFFVKIHNFYNRF